MKFWTSPPRRLGMMIVILLGILTFFVPIQPARAALQHPRWILRRDGRVLPIHKYNSFRSPSKLPDSSASTPLNVPLAGNPLPPPRPLPGSVIGKDGRVQVHKTANFPYAAISQLEIYFPRSADSCTGWMIGPHTLVTAAHCIYDNGYGGYASSIMVIPGRNGTVAPFGGFAAVDWYTNVGWAHTQKTKYDYAVIQLGTDIDALVGYFGYGYRPNFSSLTNDRIRLTGYPGDKVYGTLWTMKGLIRHVTRSALFYGIDTFAGQSGSPVYGKWGNCNPCSFGIHTYGVLPENRWAENSATRISKPVFELLCTARGGC